MTSGGIIEEKSYATKYNFGKINPEWDFKSWILYILCVNIKNAKTFDNLLKENEWIKA